jgi:hypothetical protein
MNHEWIPARPCPACGHANPTGYCTISASSGNVCCGRLQSAHELPDGRWLHRFKGGGSERLTYCGRVFNISASTPRADFAGIAEAYRQAALPHWIDDLAVRLGVTADSLNRLGIGWAFDSQTRKGHTPEVFDAGEMYRECSNRVWAVPMFNAVMETVGIMLRRDDGNKLAVAGGKVGLFIPSNLPRADYLLICEGLTDTAAILDLGFAAIGRPSCTGGRQLAVDFVRSQNIASVVILADNDAPGQFGASSLAGSLRLYIHDVRVIAPPPGIKDGRAWRIAGATAADMQAAIDAATRHEIRINVMAEQIENDMEVIHV